MRRPTIDRVPWFKRGMPRRPVLCAGLTVLIMAGCTGIELTPKPEGPDPFLGPVTPTPPKPAAAPAATLQPPPGGVASAAPQTSPPPSAVIPAAVAPSSTVSLAALASTSVRRPATGMNCGSQRSTKSTRRRLDEHRRRRELQGNVAATGNAHRPARCPPASARNSDERLRDSTSSSSGRASAHYPEQPGQHGASGSATALHRGCCHGPTE